MKPLLLLLTLGLLLATAPLAPAQQEAPPAPQVAKLHKTLGNWQGSGNVVMAPGQPPLPWTATQTVSKILDGHFIQDDMRVEAGGQSMEWRSVTGWDATSGVYRFFSVTNGQGMAHGIQYLAGGKVIGSVTMMDDGQLITDQHVVDFKDDSYTVRIDRSIAGGEFFTHVEGSFKKGGPGFAALAAGSEAKPMGDHWKSLTGMVGNWKMEAKMAPAPGAPMIDVTASQNVHFILGGHTLYSDLIGDPVAELGNLTYHGQYYQAWDSREKRLFGYWISNMGEFMKDETFFMDDGVIVSISAGVNKGMPTAHRGVTTPDGEGGFVMKGWSMTGAMEPELGFKGKLMRVEGTK